MERLHEKRDSMEHVDFIVLPRIKDIIDENMVESAHCKALWDGRQNFHVKWRGIGFCVNLQQQTCSCRVWDLTGIPCSHAICAIQKMRQNVYDFVSHWFKKETYMKTYSHCLEVLRGSPFWEETEGDIIFPPPMMKQLRGRPKKQRRRERWEGKGREGSVSKGKFSKLTKVGRVMHCTLCRNKGHNKSNCPTMSQGGVQKPPQKRGRKKKAMTAEEVAVEVEVEKIQEETQIGEAELMEEVLRVNAEEMLTTVGSSQQSCNILKMKKGRPSAAPRRKK